MFRIAMMLIVGTGVALLAGYWLQSGAGVAQAQPQARGREFGPGTVIGYALASTGPAVLLQRTNGELRHCFIAQRGWSCVELPPLPPSPNTDGRVNP